MPLEILWNVFTATEKVKLSSIYVTLESLLTILIEFVLLSLVKDQYMKMFIIAGTSAVMEIISGVIFLPLMSARLLNVSYFTFYKPLLRVLISIGLVVIIGFMFRSLWIFDGLLSLVFFCRFDFYFCVNNWLGCPYT